MFRIVEFSFAYKQFMRMYGGYKGGEDFLCVWHLVGGWLGSIIHDKFYNENNGFTG